MKINDIKWFLNECIVKDVKIPALLVGTMGVGKSQIVKQITDERGIQLVDLRLAQQESGDLIGIPYKDADGATHWAQPEWWPKEGTKGVVFLDELNRAPNDVRQAVFQLVLDRKLHTHKLPDGWYVHAAVNPDNGNYQVESLDPAMLRRFINIVVTPDVDVWMAWAKGQGKIDGVLTEFVNSNRQLLYKAEEIKLNVVPTPDSYRMLNTLMAAGVVKKDIQAELFGGLLGTEASIALIKFMDTNYNKPVSGTEILNDLKKVTAKIKKQRNDENYITSSDLVAILKNKQELKPVEFENLVQYIMMIPKESQVVLINNLSSIPTITKALFKDKRIETLVLNLNTGE